MLRSIDRLADEQPAVSSARELACRVLVGNLERVRHSAAVAARAASLTAGMTATDASLLVSAAWLHDIGYSPALKDSAFHPLDGARFLRSTGWEPVVCNLVAHHSGSRFVAAVKGLDAQIAEFPYVEGPLSDALTVADQTIGPHGKPLSSMSACGTCLTATGPSPPMRSHIHNAVATSGRPSTVSGVDWTPGHRHGCTYRTRATSAKMRKSAM